MSQWPVNKAYFWDRAPFFRLLLPLVAGIGLYGFSRLSLISILLTGIAGILSYATTAFVHKRSYWLNAGSSIALHLSIICLGWLLSYYNDDRNKHNWFAKDVKAADAYIAEITAPPAEKEKTWKLPIAIKATLQNGKLQNTTGKAFVYAFKDADNTPLHEGDVVMIPAEWQPIQNTGNPYEFDYATYCAHNNIYYQQFIGRKDIVIYKYGDSTQLPLLKRVHNWCMQQLADYITDKPTLGLIQAMLIGDEANLDADLRQAYSETGIIHVIAISGSHITMFFVFITFLLGWIRHKKYHWLKYMLALPLIWFYVMMAGASPSAVRAAIMFSILAIGFAFQKTPNILNQLFATAFILLCAQPMWLYAVGFQLSFIAVLSLVLFYRPIYKLYVPANKILRGLWAAAVASLAAEILVAPLVVYYFHLFPLLFIVANVAAYLFMGLVLLLGMAIIAFSFLPAVAAVLASVTVYMVSAFHKLVYGMQAINPVSFRYLNLKDIELLLLYIFVAAVAIYLFRQRKGSLYLAATTLSLLMLSFCYNEWQALHQQVLIVYNINKTNHVEWIDGKQHTILRTDTAIDERKKNYTLKPVHSALYAWHKSKTSSTDELLLINGWKVLILVEHNLANTNSFPVDYLIVNDMHTTAAEAGRLQQVFNPKKIIIGSNFNRRSVQEWINTCKSLNIPLHATSINGAFILKNS